MMRENYIHHTARLLSALLTPFYVPTLAFLFLFHFTYFRLLPLSYKGMALLIVYAFTVLLPMLAIYLYQKVNGWTLRHLGRKERRVVPYILTTASYAACLLLLGRMGAPRSLTGVLVASLMALVACSVVNIWWRISAHMAAIGEFVGGLVAFSLIFYYNPVVWLSVSLLLAGALGTSRMIRQRHTLAEVLTGFAIGLASGLLGILVL